MKPASRSVVKRALAKLCEGSGIFLKDGEEFSPDHKGAIWTSNEHGVPALDDRTLFGTYSEPYGPHPKLQTLLDELGWYVEPYDAGTLMVYKA